MGYCYDYVWWDGWIKLRDGNGKGEVGIGRYTYVVCAR
jgi:hypothetical protein